MATYNATHTGGGTVGHPSGVAKAYVMTSPVYDAVDNTDLEQGDVVQLMDLPADSMIIGGCIETLEASGNAQITYDVGITGTDVDSLVDGGGSNAAAAVQFNLKAAGIGSLVTSADTLDLLVIDAASSKTTAWRFRAHVVLVDISKNPVEAATVTTGT
ncbi:MAG TPA: hypothetical protein EYQ21_04575 [Flavobacteriales bacterium]|nr:hypothetical protein [Flavobacteriales bacterium]